MASAEDAIQNVNERLLHDSETKDVEIEMSDGTMRAHSIILMAASDAVRGMLSHGIARDAATKRLCWNEHTLDVGRFFLRLLYTGAVNEGDWTAGSPSTDVAGVREVPIYLMVRTPNGQTEYAGHYELVRDSRPNDKPMWKKLDAERWIFGIDDRWCMCTSSTKAEGFTTAKGHIQSFEQSQEVPPNGVTGWRRHDGNKFVRDDEISVTEPEQQVPLRLLLGGLAIAKKYLFQDLLRVFVQALKKRIMPETFDVILSAAIKADTLPLRWHCIQYAQRPQTGIQQLYKAGRLSREVQVELEGTWEGDDPPKKRRRAI